MNMVLNNHFLRVTSLLLFFFVSSNICLASEEVPLLPMTVQGTASVDGTAAPSGTIVAAYLNGEQVGNFSINTLSGDYCFWIPGTNADEGKSITFAVDGKNPGKILTWKPGQQVISLQLSVGRGANSADYVKSLTSIVSSESLTKIEKPKASGKGLEARVIESSVPEPDVNVLKSTSVNSLGKETANSVGDFFKQIGVQSFTFACAAAGAIVLILGFILVRKKRIE